MKTEKVLVRSGGSIVDTYDLQRFDALDEAVETLGDDVVLRMVNAQHRADESNKRRAEQTKITPKERDLLKKIRSGEIKV